MDEYDVIRQIALEADRLQRANKRNQVLEYVNTVVLEIGRGLEEGSPLMDFVAAIEVYRLERTKFSQSIFDEAYNFVEMSIAQYATIIAMVGEQANLIPSFAKQDEQRVKSELIEKTRQFDSVLAVFNVLRKTMNQKRSIWVDIDIK